MKIFACSDFHGCRPAIDKTSAIADRADLILLCGDICGKRMGAPTDNLPEFQRNNLKYFASVLDRQGTPWRYIFGNDDWIEDTLPNRLTAPETIGGITFLPMDIVPINRRKTNREVDDSFIADFLTRYSGTENAIVIAHTPPYGLCDLSDSGKNCGSSAALEWIKKNAPRAWFCGHIHEAYGHDMIGNTHVFNCAVWLWDASLRGWLFDTDTGEFESIMI